MSTLTRKIKNTGAYQAFRKAGKNLRKNVKRFFLTRKLKKATPVFIFQMGKVASSSIHHSLKKQYPGAVAHAHHIGSDNWASEVFYDWYKNGKPLNIISPIRDPIGRNISGFFQLLDDYTGVPYKDSTLTTDELLDVFIKQYTHERPLEWFDRNIKEHFGIDVYATPFPEDGIATYSHNNINLLVFRIDLDDRLKEKAIQDFLDFKSFKLENRNVSTNKEYYDSYKAFTSTIKLPDEYLQNMKNSQYFNHFYTNDEIDKIISRWK
jgi:hypothetical protein